MAIAVDQRVLEVQQDNAKPSRYRVKYKRRFWDVNTASYKLETTDTEIPIDEVKDISSSRESLDRKGVNIFQISNITIELENLRNKWKPDNQSGVLAIDNIARLGYDEQLMEFSVDVFYTFRDGSESNPVPMFTGRASNFDFRPETDSVSITVESKSILLEQADAENVSTDRIGIILIGTIDGINTTFTSVHSGVGRVDAVFINGIPQRLGADVQVSNLNEPDIPATFEFSAAPPIAATVTADYITWLFDQTIEAFVGFLCDEAGIGPTERDISPVEYPNFVLNKEIFTDQTDWDTGTLVNIESTSRPGDILLQDLGGDFGLVDDFEDGDFSSNPTWTSETGSWSVISLLGSKRLVTGPIGAFEQKISLLFTKAEGTWQFVHSYQNPNGVNSIPVFPSPPFIVGGFEFRFMEKTNGDRYELFVGDQFSAINPPIQLILRKFVGGVPTNLASFIIPGGIYTDSSLQTWRITRNNTTGEMKVYLNGTLRMTASDLSVTTSDFIKIRADGATGGLGNSINNFDDIRFIDVITPPPGNVQPSGSWESPIIDTGAGNPAAYGLLDHIDFLPVGTSLLYETKTSADGITFSAYVAISPGNVILSPTDRFIRVRVTLTSDPGQTLTPIVSEIAVNFSTTTTSIRLGNFTRLTVFQAISELGKIANFEWGISRAGRFFFRRRTFSNIPVLTITLANLVDFRRVTDGSSRVFNQIRAQYGDHERIINPTRRNDSGPNSFDRFGVRTLNVGSTQLLLDPDADIATGLSISYFEEFKNPRRSFEMDVDLRPQLELADTVLLRILDAVPDPKWHIGDSSRAIGDTDISLYGEKQQSAYEILARVLSLRNSLRTMKTGLELEEIT